MFRFTGSYCLLWLITSLQLVAQSTQIHYLCGTDKENPAQWDFLIDKGRKSGSWQKNNVPSCWEMEGFGEYSFGSLPFNEKAVYQYQFIALPSWQGKHINLVFEGMLTDTKVKLNRQTIGIHRSGYMRLASTSLPPLNTAQAMNLKLLSISAALSRSMYQPLCGCLAAPISQYIWKYYPKNTLPTLPLKHKL
jgi:hypothetical protein